MLRRHAIIGLLAVFVVCLFWLSRPKLQFNTRLWRALGDASFSFLFITLAIGPLAKLWPPAGRLIVWRRFTGIYFALLALAHFLRVSSYAASEPGLELPRLLGLMALFFAMALAATSSNRAVIFLGFSSWKWLHYGAYSIFYLTATHIAFFYFFYLPSSDWFRYPFLTMALAVPLLQAAAFIKIVSKNSRTHQRL